MNQQAPNYSSEQLILAQQSIRSQVANRENIISGIADLADGFNSLGKYFGTLGLPSPVMDNISILAEGVEKILQAMANLNTQAADGLRDEADSLTPVIEQAKLAESGIAVPSMSVRKQ